MEKLFTILSTIIGTSSFLLAKIIKCQAIKESFEISFADGKQKRKKSFYIKIIWSFFNSSRFLFCLHFHLKEWVGNFVENLSQTCFKLPDNQPPVGDESKLIDCQQAERNDRRHWSICFSWASSQHVRYCNRRSAYGENILHLGQGLWRSSIAPWRMDLRLICLS